MAVNPTDAASLQAMLMASGHHHHNPFSYAAALTFMQHQLAAAATSPFPGAHHLSPAATLGVSPFHQAMMMHTPLRQQQHSSTATAQTAPHQHQHQATHQRRQTPATSCAGAMRSPAEDRYPHHHATGVAAAGTGVGAISSVKGLGKRLEKDLADATREELLQMILELTYLSPQVADHIQSKAQAMANRPRKDTPLYDTTSSGLLAPTVLSFETPEKPRLIPSSIMLPHDPTTVNPSSSAPAPSTSSAMATPRASAAGTASSASTPLPASARSPVVVGSTAETRQWSDERHPCLAVYGNCRFPRTCMFASCPQNLCLAFVRGHCTQGSQCSLVHRVPHPCSEALLHLFSIQRHRGDETIIEAATAVPPPSAAADDEFAPRALDMNDATDPELEQTEA